MQIITLIPGFKSEYANDLIRCLRNQTYKSKKIVISDDSDNNFYTDYLRSNENRQLIEDLPIEFIIGPKKGAYENTKYLIKRYSEESDLIHILYDDDVIYPTFYENHLRIHSSGFFSCSISARWSADESGFAREPQPIPAEVKNHQNALLSLSEEVMLQTTICECKNWLGEFSNTVIRKEFCYLLLNPNFMDISYAGLWDLGFFINASLSAPVGYIKENLGFFRQGKSNNSSKIFGPYMKAAFLAYGSLAYGLHRIGKITEDEKITCFKNLYIFLNNYYLNEDDMKIFIQYFKEIYQGNEKIPDEYIHSWNNFLKLHNFTE